MTSNSISQKIIPSIKGLLNPFGHLYKHRDLLLNLLIRSIQSKYQASMLGMLWAFITPLMLLTIYTFVFSVIFEARWGSTSDSSKMEFALVLMCGLTIYNIFAESFGHSTQLIINNPNYVKKVIFPLELLPLITCLTALFFGVLWFVVLIFGIGISNGGVPVTVIALPLVLLPVVLISCGLCWFAASLGVYVRDLPHFVTLLLRMLFFLTPIFYPIGRVPLPYRNVLYLNPLTPAVQQMREILIYSHWPNFYLLGGLTLVSFAIFHLGFIWFMKTKRGFADVM